MPAGEVETVACQYMCEEVLVRGLNPLSVKTVYIPHIKNVFTIERVVNKFAEALSSQVVKLTWKGIERIDSKRNPRGGVKKIAFTLDLVKYLDAALGNIAQSANEWKENMRRRALVVGLEMGIYFLLRKSEYLPCTTADGETSRGLTWNEIQFLDGDGRVLDFMSMDAISVRSMSLLVQTSKMDQHGEGRIRTHHRQREGHCIVSLVVQWALEARACGDGRSSYLFERFGAPLISDISVADSMKAITRYLGLGDNMISAHSLRYGGATMLASAGLPSYVITYFGGWAEGSAMIRRYAQIGGEAVGNVSRIMSGVYEQSIAESRARINTLSRK
jgi:hypothetical protein